MGNSFEYLFLTLTVPNCSPDELDNTLTRLFKAFDRLMKRRNVKRAVHGFFRALEVTRNDEHDTYHPHFHCVLAVNPSYFHKADYIPQSEWLQMWRDAYGDQSITQVDVRKAKPKKSTFDELGNLVSNDLGSVVAEVAKYTVKSSDYIFPNDPEKTDRVINVLAGALKSRRLVQYGGIFKKLHKELNLSDPEDGDLINVTDELHPALAHIILTYSWSIGAYKLMSREFLSIDAKQFIPDAPEGSVIHLDLDKPFPLAQITAAEWCGASQDEWTELYESATTEDD
jgi:plasmid rolling circle replication initiator protein Rep